MYTLARTPDNTNRPEVNARARRTLSAPEAIRIAGRPIHIIIIIM